MFLINLSILTYYIIYVPITIYILLNYVSGTPITDKFMAKIENPDLKKYIEETSSFWPWFKLK